MDFSPIRASASIGAIRIFKLSIAIQLIKWPHGNNHHAHISTAMPFLLQCDVCSLTALLLLISAAFSARISLQTRYLRMYFRTYILRQNLCLEQGVVAVAMSLSSPSVLNSSSTLRSAPLPLGNIGSLSQSTDNTLALITGATF